MFNLKWIPGYPCIDRKNKHHIKESDMFVKFFFAAIPLCQSNINPSLKCHPVLTVIIYQKLSLFHTHLYVMFQIKIRLKHN